MECPYGCKNWPTFQETEGNPIEGASRHSVISRRANLVNNDARDPNWFEFIGRCGGPWCACCWRLSHTAIGSHRRHRSSASQQGVYEVIVATLRVRVTSNVEIKLTSQPGW